MLNKLILATTLTLLRALCRQPYIHFQKSLNNPQIAQQTLLKSLLNDLAKSDYGISHGITGNETYKEFAEKIPAQSFDQLHPWIARQLSMKNAKIITPHQIVHVEPTSGSTSKTKKIPYTKSLIGSFTNMFSIWVYDLLSNGFNPDSGRMFISISPGQRKSNSANDPGFASDRDYLAEPLKSLLSRFLIGPPVTIDDSNFHHELALTLLEDDQLEVISIWSPTYLLSVLDYIENNRSNLDRLLKRRILSLSHDSAINWKQVWPRLKLISCWDSAMAQTQANQVRQIFPNVHVQGKGLLATEAPITVPLVGHGCLPLLNDVFLEFETEQGSIKRLDQLVDGERYQVIVTQKSGLTRYRIHDIVEVHGFYRNTAQLEFVGRANLVCDLAGEKLQEEFVRRALTAIFPSLQFLLIPSAEKSLGYVLAVDSQHANELCRCDNQQNHDSEGVARLADEALSQSHHYRLARAQGQIAPLRLKFIQNLTSKMQIFHQGEGMKVGNIKDVSLLTDLEKATRLLLFLSEQKDSYEPLQASSLAQSSFQPSTSLPQLQVPVGA